MNDGASAHLAGGQAMIAYEVACASGSGKTRAATEFAVSLPTTNFCIVMPTRKLIVEAASELRRRRPEASHRIAVLIGESSREPVTHRIAEFLKAVHEAQGSILFVTHEAFLRLPHWHLKKHWHLIVDEALQATWCETFTLRENREKLCGLLKLTQYDDKYSRIEPRNAAAIRSIADNAAGDQITALFSAVASKLLHSSHWRLFVDHAAFTIFTRGESRQIELHGLLGLNLFDGFASVTMMGANLRESLMYRLFARLGCQFREHLRITSGLRFTDHENGRRLSILYFTDRKWSKSLRDSIIDIKGEPSTVGDAYLREIRSRFDGRPYLWIANNDVAGVLEGVRLPNIPHGLNDFQNYDRCVVVSALNPSEGHRAFLETMAGIDERQVRRALLSQVAYQSAGRGSLRDLAAHAPFILIVPDKDTADDVAAMYPGCMVSRLTETDCIPPAKKPGRKPVHDSAAARAKAAKRRWSWKQNKLESISLLKDDFDSINGGGFVFSLWREYRTRTWENQRHQTTDQFFKQLRWRFENREYNRKDDNYLCSPTLFAEAGQGHTLANIAHVMGVAIDLDGTNMTPDDIARALPEVELLIVSSWSHSPDEDPCYRIYIPTTSPMTSEASKAIRMSIVRRFGEAGFRDQHVTGLHHGTDMSKLHSAALFYLPCKRPNGFLAEHRDNRRPIDPSKWIMSCPADIVDAVIDHRDNDQMSGSAMPGGYADWQKSGFARASQIWRAHAQGEGNHQFHRLGWRLHGFRMAIGDIERTLTQEAWWSVSRGDRLDQIPYVLADIQLRG